MIFIYRISEARRSHRVWSRRRAYVSAAALIVLVLQILNLIFMLATAALILEDECAWRTDTIAVLGYLQWSCWNGLFFVLVVLAHNGALWRGRTADGRSASLAEDGTARAKGPPSSALVLDASVFVHVPKIAIWFTLQVTLSVFLWALLSSLPEKNTACEEGLPTKCGPDDLTIAMLSLTMVTVWLYAGAYTWFSYRTNADVRSRPYNEMRFARMVFGLQHDQVLPVFVALVICILLLSVIQIDSCWTYVETW